MKSGGKCKDKKQSMITTENEKGAAVLWWSEQLFLRSRPPLSRRKRESQDRKHADIWREIFKEEAAAARAKALETGVGWYVPN